MDRLEYVYLIRHTSTGMFYAGSSYGRNCHPSKFWVEYYTSSKAVQAIIESEGVDSFEVLEVIPRPMNDAREYEYSLLASVDAARSPMWLNKTNGHGKFGCNGPRSEETKRKISIAKKGKTRGPNSDESNRKRSETLKGYKHSDEFREKISKARIGITYSEETLRRMSKASTGRKQSVESKQRKSEALIGIKRSDETRQRMSEAQRNKPTVVCPHCMKEGASGGMTRWHFDNCKQKGA